jgi:hypothetical protein
MIYVIVSCLYFMPVSFLAMWLNGFNDNLPGFPRLPCKYTSCTGGRDHKDSPYMGDDVQPGVPIDPSKPRQGPHGSVRYFLPFVFAFVK